MSASIVLVPALLLGGSTLGNDLPFSIPVGGLLLLGAVVGLFALLHAVAVAVASRSGRIALDAVLALLVGYGAAAAFARLPRFMAAEPFRIACVAFAVAAIVAALVAGYASLARGRTDIQAAHRALSFVLWVGLGAAAFGVNAYAWWVMAAGPGNLGAYFDVTPAPAGGWLVAGGSARGAQATFLLDTVGGRSARAPVVDWQAPHFSMDGQHAVWVEGRDQGGPVAVWTWNLADRDASPVRTQLLLPGYPDLVVLSDDGSRLAIAWEGLLSVYELPSARALASVRIDTSGVLRAMFIGNERLRLYHSGWPEFAPLEITELDVAAKTLAKTGTSAPPAGAVYFTANRAGDRLILISMKTGEAWLNDGLTGRPLAVLGSPTPKTRWGGFLQDGRIVLTGEAEAGRILRVFSPNGAPVREFSFPGAQWLTPGGEAAPGKLIVGVGDPLARRIELLDIDTGASRRIASGLSPAARLSNWTGQPNVSPAVGSEATKLFLRWGEGLVRLDPFTGERRVILGEDRATPRSSGTPRSNL